MSVMTFGAEELSNVAAAILSSMHRPSSRDIHEVCANLALVSKANVACFNDKYGARHALAAPASLGDIEVGIKARAGMFSCNLRDALSTANLLRYNCIDDGGDFTLKVEGAAAALVEVLEGLLHTVSAKISAVAQ